MRFSGFDSFDESDIKGACLKAKLGLGTFLKNLNPFVRKKEVNILEI
mgnify:CR=1 FL=1